MLELKNWRLRLAYLYRLQPLMGKFTQTHFVNGMGAVMNILAQLVIHFYMWRSWCYVSSMEIDGRCKLAMTYATQHGIAEEQILLNSWIVLVQQRATAAMAACSILSGGLGAVYFRLVQDRVEDDAKSHCVFGNPLLHWLCVELQVSTFGLLSSF